MAQQTDSRTPEAVRRDIEVERDRLASAVDDLKAGIDDATNVSAKLRSKLPAVAGAAFATGFVLWGGIGATMRLLARRSREGETAARIGPFRLVDRR